MTAGAPPDPDTPASRTRAQARDGLAMLGGMGQLKQLISLNYAAIGPDKPLLAAAIVLSLLSGLAQTMLLFLLAMAAVAMSSARGAPSLFALFGWARSIPAERLLLLAAALALLVILLAMPIARIQSSIGARAGARARHRLIQAYLAADLDYRSRHREGQVQQLIGDYCQNLTFATQQFTQVCTGGGTLLTLMAAPLLLNPKVGGPEIVLIVVTFLAVGPLTRRRRRETRRRVATTSELSSQAAQMARLGDEIATLNVGRQVAESLARQVDEVARLTRRATFRDLSTPTLYQFGALAVLLAAVAAFFWAYPGQHPSLGAIALILARVLTYGRQVIALAQQWTNFVPAIELIEDELADMAAHAPTPGTLSHARFDGLQLEGVAFAHPGGAMLFDAATLHIAPGEAIGLVGPSGQGKSSFCALLARLRRPSRGRILMNGIDLDHVDPESWAQILAYVPQDPQLMLASVADNIRFFRHGFGRDAIERAARAAHLHEEIAALPQGYDTLVGPGVRGLSGGQRQRLVIARALLGTPRLLVLDEPSSALDARSEALIVETLRKQRGRMAMLVVTHRPAMLSVCDRVYALDRGTLGPIAAAG